MRQADITVLAGQACSRDDKFAVEKSQQTLVLHRSSTARDKRWRAQMEGECQGLGGGGVSEY